MPRAKGVILLLFGAWQNRGSEAMLFAVGEHVLGRVPGECVRMASALAGGVAGSHQELCGALSGGVLTIGGLLGRSGLGEDDKPAMALAVRYRERFLAEFGATRCAPVRESVKAPGGPGSCAYVVERSAAILLELLEEAGRHRAIERSPATSSATPRDRGQRRQYLPRG